MEDEEKNPELPLENELPAPTSAADRWREGIKKKYSDRQFETDDDFYEASMSGYDQEHETVKSMRESNKTLADKMEADPKAAAALAEFMEGKPLPVALRKYFDDEELSMSEGDEKYEDYLKAVNERVARAEQNKQMQAEYEAALLQSQADMDAFAQSKGMSPEEFDTFMTTATSKLIEPLLKGSISTETMEMLYKGMNYENDLAVAADVNYKKGKNEKIIESKRAVNTDGLPNTSGGTAPASVNKQNPTADALDAIISRSASEDIYARGGFKRKGKG
jgi:hypothetical protein